MWNLLNEFLRTELNLVLKPTQALYTHVTAYISAKTNIYSSKYILLFFSVDISTRGTLQIQVY